MGTLSYVALGGVVLGIKLAGYVWSTSDAPRAPAPVAKPRTAKLPAFVAPPRAPALPSIDPIVIEDDDAAPAEPEPVRGLAPIEDPAEFAMVFRVGSTSYLRLSTEERATVRGAAQMREDNGVHSVVAPVPINGMPAALQGWAGKSVLVDGTCRARVIGFAEVSRVAGDSEDMWDPETGEPRDPAPWTIETITADGVTLAAVLDGCEGSWARAESHGAAAVAAVVSAPELEDAALANLLATDAELQQQEWSEMGGEGRWEDAADVRTAAYEHPLTNERWIFVQASRDGSCGEPGFSRMAAYRVGDDGAVQRFADLQFGHETIRDVVDVDGDGQPELVLADGDRTELVDLANERHESIDVPYHHYGCGC